MNDSHCGKRLFTFHSWKNSVQFGAYFPSGFMETNPLFAERLEKRSQILSSGISPYGKGFLRTKNAEDAKSIDPKTLRIADDIKDSPHDDVKIAGRLMTFREHGRIAFGQMQDHSGRMQVCFMKGFSLIAGIPENDEISHEHFWSKLIDLGDFLGLTGDLFQTKHGEITLLVHTIEILAKSLRPLPEKWHGLTDREACYRERHLDLLTNKNTEERFQVRSKVIRGIRKFLDEKDFLEVETRILQPQAGGALAKIFETHHNALDHTFVLRIALELDLKILLAGGMERVYEIGKCFRNEGMDPSHLQEFTMLEWYAAYATLEENMKWTEEMLRTVLYDVLGLTSVTVLDKDEKPVVINFGGEWKKERFPDLLKKYARIDMFSAKREILEAKAAECGMEKKLIGKTSNGNLLDFIYKKTARPRLIEPTFVLDYPSELKPLAKPKGDGTAECYQLIVAGWEIVNSYGELVDPVIQRELLEAQAKAKVRGDEEAMDVDEEFLRAMEHGMPPMTGFGMGIDRFVALITEQPNLRDVVLFPLMKPQESESIPKEKIRMKKPHAIKTNEEHMKASEESKKFVAILNKKIDSGKLMNALGHMAAGVAGGSGSEMCFLDYRDADDNPHPFISHFPFIVLKADNANQIRVLREKALALGVEYTDFTSTMAVGSSFDQLKRTKDTKEEDLDYYGICLFGTSEQIDPLTKKFSLWK